MGESEGGNEGPQNRGKVADLVNRYEKLEIGDELERRWTAEENRMSLRDLADYFNTELVRVTLEDQCVDVLEGEAANLHRLLTSSDVSRGDRVQVENKLERDGVDVDRLKEDFVSRQSIHTYLTREREATYESTSQGDRLTDRRRSIQRMKSRTKTVTENILSELQTANDVFIGRFQLLVTVRVQCVDCGGQYEISDFLSRSQCDCATTAAD